MTDLLFGAYCVTVVAVVSTGLTLLVWFTLPGEKCRCKCPTARAKRLRRKPAPVPPAPAVAPATPRPAPYLSSNVVVLPGVPGHENGGRTP